MSATLTVREAAEILSCNPETVRRLCRKGELKSFKLGTSQRAVVRIPVNQKMISDALGGVENNKGLLALVESETEKDQDEAFFE
jgi:excisionase family DNA binding protein